MAIAPLPLDGTQPPFPAGEVARVGVAEISLSLLDDVEVIGRAELAHGEAVFLSR